MKNEINILYVPLYFAFFAVIFSFSPSFSLPAPLKPNFFFLQCWGPSSGLGICRAGVTTEIQPRASRASLSLSGSSIIHGSVIFNCPPVVQYMEFYFVSIPRCVAVNFGI